MSALESFHISVGMKLLIKVTLDENSFGCIRPGSLCTRDASHIYACDEPRKSTNCCSLIFLLRPTQDIFIYLSVSLAYIENEIFLVE